MKLVARILSFIVGAAMLLPGLCSLVFASGFIDGGDQALLQLLVPIWILTFLVALVGLFFVILAFYQ